MATRAEYEEMSLEELNRLLLDPENIPSDEEVFLIAEVMAEKEERAQIPALGVPTEDFEETTGTEPFRQDSPYRHIQNLDPVQYRQLQDSLVAVGLLNPESDNFVPGRVTVNDPTVGALGKVMQFANNTGRTLNGALKELQQQVTAGDISFEDESEEQRRGRFIELPDTATLQARVESTFKESLGRNPTQAEMRIFTDELMANYKSKADVEQQNFEDAGAGRVVQRQTVDPVARFRQSFQEKMQGQIESIEEQEGAQQGAQIAAANVNSAEQEATQ